MCLVVVFYYQFLFTVATFVFITIFDYSKPWYYDRVARMVFYFLLKVYGRKHTKEIRKQFLKKTNLLNKDIIIAARFFLESKTFKDFS